MNITRSSSSIGTVGNLLIAQSTIGVVGSFASFFKTFTLQGQDDVPNAIYNRNFTSVELNGILRTSTFITGKIIFAQGAGTYNCDMELRRKAGMLFTLLLINKFYLLKINNSSKGGSLKWNISVAMLNSYYCQ
jgi:hypothetical protein